MSPKSWLLVVSCGAGGSEGLSSAAVFGTLRRWATIEYGPSVEVLVRQLEAGAFESRRLTATMAPNPHYVGCEIFRSRGV
ncbi:hypothetical protein B1806_03910 [Metallibacterium scheffleri]|uniref:Uncharacterized protein n=1 Tax=Metallibacterium scheffleri TaxID=993689 RepID=A0A4S3KQG2_9GAMM|nr:hypothetical protein B1806_03910 [Metallibacterium scheffleri]